MMLKAPCLQSWGSALPGNRSCNSLCNWYVSVHPVCALELWPNSPGIDRTVIHDVESTLSTIMRQCAAREQKLQQSLQLVCFCAPCVCSELWPPCLLQPVFLPHLVCDSAYLRVGVYLRWCVELKQHCVCECDFRRRNFVHCCCHWPTGYPLQTSSLTICQNIHAMSSISTIWCITMAYVLTYQLIYYSLTR